MSGFQGWAGLRLVNNYYYEHSFVKDNMDFAQHGLAQGISERYRIVFAFGVWLFNFLHAVYDGALNVVQVETVGVHHSPESPDTLLTIGPLTRQQACNRSLQNSFHQESMQHENISEVSVTIQCSMFWQNYTRIEDFGNETIISSGT